MGRARVNAPPSAKRRSGARADALPAGARVFSNDLYEADDRQADPRRHTADRGAAAQPDSFEELPEQYDDEEIDEDAAWTADDEARWGDHFAPGRRAAGGDDGGDGGGDDDEDDDFDNGDADPWEQLEAGRVDRQQPEPPHRGAAPGSAGAAQRLRPGPADVDAFLASDEEDDEALSDGLEEDEDGGDGIEGEQRHALMLRAAGVGEHTRKRKLAKVVLTEAYPESEYNLNPALGSAGDIGDGAASLSVADLARGLNNAAVPGAVRAKLRRLETATNAAPLAAPVPPAQAARVQRGAAYAVASEHVTRWQPLVKANREARTLVFPASNAGAPKPASTTAALAAAFTVDTQLEQQVAALLSAGGAATSAGVRAAEAAELQAAGGSSSEAKERTARLAKMRALLFYHESKAKRLKNIKSKGYHRHAMQLAKRALRKLGDTDAGQGGEGDASAAAELEAAEMARMTERFGLKHRNTSRWARRLLAKGLGKLPATRQALAEQMRLGEELRAKPLGRRGARQSDGEDGTDASDDDDGGLDDGDDDDDGEEDNPDAAAKKRAGKHATRARQEALDVLLEAKAGGSNGAQGGLLSLPFMQRAQAKARSQAAQAAADLLAELDGEAGGGAAADGDADEWDVPLPDAQGRMVFGGGGAAADGGDGGDDEPGLERGSDESDGEYEQRSAQAATAARMRRRAAAAAGGSKPGRSSAPAQPAMAPTTGGHGSVPRVARNAAAGPGAGLGAGLAAARSAATQLDMAMGAEEDAPAPIRRKRQAAAASGAAAGADGKPPNSKERRKAARLAGQGAAPEGTAPQPAAPGARTQPPSGVAPHSGVPLAPGSGRHAAGDDGDDGDAPAEELVGGVSARQRAVIAAAFAGDDVAAEFASAKAAEVAAEAPDDGTAILATAVLPGWGAWAEEQSVPKAAKAAAAVAKARAAAAVASRKDAGKAHVIVSEKFDRKAATYTVPSLPYPYTSREVFDSTLRQPLSREVNTDASFRDLTRPQVVTTPGALIAPIKFKRVQPAAQKGGKQQAKGGKQAKQAARK